jgi:hypothetical protein
MSSPSNRFVKWINRRNVRRQFDKEKVKRTTQTYLFGAKHKKDTHGEIVTSTADNVIAPQTVLSDKSLLDTYDDEEDGNHENITEIGLEKQLTPPSSPWRQAQKSESFDQWECIPKDSHIELCKIPSDLHDDGASIR